MHRHHVRLIGMNKKEVSMESRSHTGEVCPVNRYPIAGILGRFGCERWA